MWTTMKRDKASSRLLPQQNGEHPEARSRSSTVLDWQILDEDEPWDEQRALPEHAGLPSGGRVRAIHVLASVVLVLAASAALYLWRVAESGAQLLESELQETITTEAWQSPLLGAGQAGARPAPIATIAAQEISFHGSTASVVVEQTTTAPDGAIITQRQRRFYQPTANGWVEVQPDSRVLGATQMRETTYFTFFYHAMDAAAVEAVAGELDEIYAELRYDYRLPPAATRLVVHLVEPPDRLTCHQRHRLCLPSPALASLPADLSEAEALRYWLVEGLVYQVRWEAIEVAPPRYGWQIAAYTLPRLQMRRHSPRLAAWQRDLVGWLYGIEQRTPRPDAETLAQELAQLCAKHQVLAYQPVMAGAAPTQLCVESPKWDLLYLAGHNPPENLGHLVLWDAEPPVNYALWMQVVAFETLLDYVVATYGPEAVPALVEGFRQHGLWTSLIPAVFDGSVEQFEAGWQAYLASLS